MSKSQNNTPVLFEVIAIKDCQKKQPDFLTFPIGEKISVLKNKGDTWLGFSKKKGIKHSGYFSRHNVFQISKSEKQYLTVDESTSETGQYTSESVSTKKFSYDFSSSTDTEIDYEDLFYSKNESIMSDDEHSEDLGKLLKSLNGNKKKFESLIKTDVNKTSYFPKDVVYDTKKKKRKKKKKKMKTKKKSNREEKKKPKVKKKTKTKNSYKDNSDSDFNKPNNKHNMKKNENINITNQNSKENNKHFHSSSNKNSNPPKGNETDNDSGDPNDSENINEVMTNSANDGVQIKFKDLKPPPKPKGKKPKLITKSLNEKISLKNKYSGEIHINSNFTWAINKKKKKKK
ncbi:hypothetical protein M0812_11884 [Anaeramoeba flamelloides]|uniref:SH3 domain-containing protein n=1 Tax=Anaeramoeba flamelloides TaxID=1746091 RepID=A0AAV7ZJK5_9EUKA|nr:hypothetical protein M0812_11884 [Anaeramoeba flamelloides]